jgi:hypothetical protein
MQLIVSVMKSGALVNVELTPWGEGREMTEDSMSALAKQTKDRLRHRIAEDVDLPR